MLVYPGAGRQQPRVRALSQGRGNAVWPPLGLCALCPLASLSVGASAHLVSPSPRLYLSLVLGNVNVTLLSKQAK